MKKYERDTIAAIGAVLDAAGVRWATQQGGKHLAVIAFRPNGEHKFPVSGSPRDPDASHNQAVQQVKHWLDQQGIGSGRGQKGETKPRRQRRVRSTLHRIEVQLEPVSGPARDPWALLRSLA